MCFLRGNLLCISIRDHCPFLRAWRFTLAIKGFHPKSACSLFESQTLRLDCHGQWLMRLVLKATRTHALRAHPPVHLRRHHSAMLPTTVLSVLATLAVATVSASPVSIPSGHWECANDDCTQEVAVGVAELHYPLLGRSIDVPDGTILNFTSTFAPHFDDVKTRSGAIVRTSSMLSLDEHLEKRTKSKSNKKKCQPATSTLR